MTATGQLGSFARLNYRYDFGDAANGNGLEVAAGLNLTVNDLRLELSGRSLLLDDTVEDWGFGATLRYARDLRGGTGFRRQLHPQLGRNHQPGRRLLAVKCGLW